MTCQDCEYIKFKETKKSNIPYGECTKTGLILVAVQKNCKYFKKSTNENLTA